MSLTEEESNFFRFYFLNLKIATKAVRVYFDNVHPPAGLASELANSYVTLKDLPFMTKPQLHILYPCPGITVTSAEFDTTLIVCLLRNLPPRESAPASKWDNLPLPGDTSRGADLARVKWYRNKLVHTNDGILSSLDFNQCWGDLEGAIGRLGGPSMLKEAQSAIHIVLDKSLIDMLNIQRDYNIHNLQITQEEHTSMIKDLQKAIDNQKIVKEHHENKTHQHYDSLPKAEGESKQKRLEDDTKALIEEDIREGTFVTTKAVTDGILLLKQNGILLITGHAGTGKSRIGRHVLHMFCTDDTSYKCIKLNTLEEWEDMVNREENVAVLIDDIFGETNCIYNREKAIPILDKVHAYVCKGKTKVIITIRDTVKHQCQEVFDSHRLFKFHFIDLSSDNNVLSVEEKNIILKKYMNTVRQSEYTDNKGFLDNNGDIFFDEDEVKKITIENPVKGFPLVVYQFVHNDKYFMLGSTFFDRPTEAMLEEMNAIRRKGEDERNFMIQYAVMVYTAINENCINPNDSSKVAEIAKIIDAIYGVRTKMKKSNILDAVKELEGSYLINIPKQRSYRLHHPTLQESVILSFAQIDEENINKIIPLISWSFFIKMVKSESYKEKEGEVVLRIPINSYILLAVRLVGIYMSEFMTGVYFFIHDLCNTEIFKQDYSLLLPCLLEAFEKEDNKDKHTENMIKSGEMYSFERILLNINIKVIFISNLLDQLAKIERQLDLYIFVLKTFKTIIKKGRCHLTIGYMGAALISSLYAVCSTKDVKNVKATLEIVEENKITVLLDQGVQLANITHLTFLFPEVDASETCVFLTLCIWKAFKVFNTPVLEFLLSKYNQTPFDINLFFKMIYRENWMENVIGIGLGMPLLSLKPLKWMITTFKDQEVYDPDILRTACKYQMFDTVRYIASGYKTFDAISCLQEFIDKPDDEIMFHKIPFNQGLFNFLLTKIDITSPELIPVVLSVIKKHPIPDYVFDAFLPVCQNNAKILTLACKNGQFYLVNLIIESSHIVRLDIQSAVIAACTETKINSSLLFDHNKAIVEVNMINDLKFKIVKYIVGHIRFDQFNLKAVCQQASSSKNMTIKERFVHNIDTTRLDVYSIINSALVNKRSDILEHIMNKIDIESLDKREVLKSVTEHYTAECATTILEIVCTIWNSTEDKEVLHMAEIVNKAYERKCFELLIWIHENCQPYISFDPKKILMLACEEHRVDVAKWIVQTCEQTTLDIDGGTLFMKARRKNLHPRYGMIEEHRIEINKLIGTLNWILATFQIKQLNIIVSVLKLIIVDEKIRNKLYNSVVSILEKCLSCLKTEDMKEMINKSLEEKYYVLVNWFLEKPCSCSFDKQMILNKACLDAEIETIKMLSNSFYALDMNQAMINTCDSSSSRYVLSYENKSFHNDQAVACLDLLWNEINKLDHDSVNIRKIVSTVCNWKKVSDNVMTWILLNLPHSKIPINEVLIACCRQSKNHHVKYIVHEVNNDQLDIKEGFVQTCKSILNHEHADLMTLDHLSCLFQMESENNSYLSSVVNELFGKKKFELILYFLQTGYCVNINMKKLLKGACRYGYVKLVQWILGNVKHKELDFKSAFHKACDGIPTYHNHVSKEQVNHVICVALLWHYIHDINMFEIDTVLKTKTESQSDTSDSDSDDVLKIWLLYIKDIHHIICRSENALLNTEENVHQHSQQINDGQCCLEDSEDNDGSSSSNEQDDSHSPRKILRFEKEEQK